MGGGNTAVPGRFPGRPPGGVVPEGWNSNESPPAEALHDLFEREKVLARPLGHELVKPIELVTLPAAGVGQPVAVTTPEVTAAGRQVQLADAPVTDPLANHQSALKPPAHPAKPRRRGQQGNRV